MNIMEMGQLLRTQRESLGLSIEELSEKTCISRRILTVFEAGDVDEYPHSVYAKGFIRNYARALNLDEELCIRALEKEFGLQVQEDAGSLSSFENLDGSSSVGKSGSPWLVFLGCIVFVGILAGLIWYFSFSGLPGAAKTSSTIQSQQSVEQPAATPVLEAVEQTPEQATEPEVTVEQGQKEVDQEAATPLSVQASAGQTGQDAVPAPEEPVALPRSGSQSELHTLGIKVVRGKECWVGVWVPGQDKIAKDFTVPAGKRVEHRFRGERIVRFGRIETVELTFDGVPRPVRGKGVVDVRFP